MWLENIFASDPAKCGAEMENKQNVELFQPGWYQFLGFDANLGV